MPDYSKGKIYRIVCNKTGLTYIGSTTYDTLAQRLCTHKYYYKKWLINPTIRKCTSVSVLEGGDYDIVLIENVNCNNKDELYQRERHWIENSECVNRVVPGRTHAEYREQHRERLREQNNEFYANHQESMIERAKTYREKNPDKIKELNKKAMEKPPVLCDCGMYYSYKHKARHLASTKHLDNI